jgi:hypothetical protein
MSVSGVSWPRARRRLRPAAWLATIGRAAPVGAPVLLAAVCTCGGDPREVQARASGESVESAALRPEFLALAEGLEQRSRFFAGRREVARLERELARPLPSERRVSLLRELVRRRVEVGAVDGAVAAAEEALALAGAGGREPEPELWHLSALAHLRQAEVENCVARHDADCCLVPLAGGGVHAVRAPALRARECLLRVLAARPDDLGERWLLNLVAQALGEYPDGVPPDLLIPPRAFRSEREIPRFRDVAPELGVDALNLCGGVAVEDFDGDGLLDVMTSTSDPRGPLTLYKNLGARGFEDVSERSRCSDQLGGLNLVAADHDGDGDVDVLILRGAWLKEDGRIRNSLLRNDAGEVFSDVTRAAGLAEPACPTQAAAWGDFDGDGALDLYVGNESRMPFDAAGDYPSQLFRNQGDGTFEDVAARAGTTNDRFAKGVTVGDYDNDGQLDLYVSNVGPNRLYRNLGDGRFSDVAVPAGVVEPVRRSFATWFFDYDDDGWLDLFVTAYETTTADLAAEALGRPHAGQPPRLYRNRGDGRFADVTREAGLARPWLPMGANFGDLEHDGWLDVYLTTGDPEFETLMPNVMLRNDAGRRFQDVTAAGGFGHLQKGHGVAFADLDNDGDQDVYHQLGGFYPGDAFHNALFLNPGGANRWLYVRLVGTRSHRSGFGARIAVRFQTPAGAREVHRAVGSVSSFGGSPFRQEIGLADATAIESLEVVWPASGVRQRFTDVPLDALVVVTEGEERLERQELRRVEF